MDSISLEYIYNLIDLCKYAEIDGEKAELIVTPIENNSRKIRVGITGGFSRDFFEFSFEDGNKFDNEILPLLISHFLKDDSVSSWVTNDPRFEEYPTKELIVSEKENELLIQSFNKEVHEIIKSGIENKQLEEKEEVFSKEELACEKVLKYLKVKHKERPELEKFSEELKNEIIEIVKNAYKINKGKTLSDEQIYNFTNNINEGITKEAYNAIINDIRNNNSVLINEIREYLRNESKYENYLDEEPYMSLCSLGEKLVEKGYFENKYSFPQKIKLEEYSKEELETVVSSKYKSKYKLLAEMRLDFENNKDNKNIELIDHYMNYLVKTTRARTNKKNKKIEKSTFKELKQEYKLDDVKTLMDALKLYKGGKLDSEKLEIVVSEEIGYYLVNIRLSNGISRDNNLFKFSINDKFKEEILPKLLEEFEKDESIKEKDENDKKTLMVTNSGNELLIDTALLNSKKVVEENKTENDQEISNENTDQEKNTDEKKNNENDSNEVVENKDNESVTNKPLSDYKYLLSYFRKEILRDKGLLSKSGIEEIKKLEEMSEDVKALEEAHRKLQSGTLSKDGFDKLHRYYRELLNEEMKKEKTGKENTNTQAEPIEKSEFDYLHELLSKYTIQNVNGELKAFNRELGTEAIFNNEDEFSAVEFANYWNSAAGIKSINDDRILGEGYAFGNDCRRLFNIIIDNFDEEKLDLDSIYNEFKNANISTSDEIFERLFRDQDHIDFVTEGLRCFRKASLSKDLDVSEEPIDLKEIRDEFTKLDSESSLENTANLLIEYHDDGYVEVKLQNEKENAVNLVLHKKIKEDFFNDKILEKVIEHYVKLDGVFKTKSMQAEDGKCSIIVIGKNSNVLQVRNASKDYLDKVESIIDKDDVVEQEKSHEIK